MKIQRMECTPVANSNVILVEPNDININTDMINGIPQYQDMYIFAELVSESKGRTVIVSGNVTSTTSDKVNFIGNDQNETNNPNHLNFTTNYYDGSNENNTYYEGFGMTSIKIVINSSFIPQVNIQFVDVRGLTFFNQTNSKYRMLFDFPPPLFKLTVKGYYGKALTYHLHLVKYTSEFSAANGNFIIDAQFVAMTFAPLADILFRYVVNAPLINNKKSYSPSTDVPPKNTYDLIMKLKGLYKAITEKLKTDKDNKRYVSVLDEIDYVSNIGDMLKTVIKQENAILETGGNVRIMIKSNKKLDASGIYPATRKSEDYNISKIETLNKYNKLIEGEGNDGRNTNPETRLIIGYEIGTNIPLISDDYISTEYSCENNIVPWENMETRNYDNYKKPLEQFSKNLLENTPIIFNIDNNDVSNPKPFTLGFSVENNSVEETEYYGIDITDYYRKIYESGSKLITEKKDLEIAISTTVNNMVQQNLGMTPSIYNIFEIILNDVDRFFEIMRTVSEEAEKSHNKSPNNTIIYGDTKGIDSPEQNGKKIPYLYSYPLIIETTNVYGGKKNERKAPLSLSEKVNFPELKLVTNFMNTFLLQNQIAEQYSERDNEFSDGRKKWIPISPFDSTIGGANPISPYLNINDNVIDESFKILMERFYIFGQGTIPQTIYNDGDAKDAYITMYANAEAINMALTLTNKENALGMNNNAKKYIKNIQGFYDYIKTLSITYWDGTKNVSGNTLYDFPDNDPKYFLITPTLNQGKVYTNKYNPEFQGVFIQKNPIILQKTNEKPDVANPLTNFSADAKNKWNLFGTNNPAEHYFEFTEDNIVYFRDNGSDDLKKNNLIDGVQAFTRYIVPKDGEYDIDDSMPSHNIINIHKNSSYPESQQEAFDLGNSSFNEPEFQDKLLLKMGNNVISTWSSDLAGLNDDTYNILVNPTSTKERKLSHMLILSNFGRTLSPFNLYPSNLNNLVFDTPSAIEVPKYIPAYIGMLIDSVENEDSWYQDIIDFFNTNGSCLPCQGYYVLADIHDIRDYLGKLDKTEFKSEYDDYVSEHKGITDGIKRMTNSVKENVNDGIFYRDEVAYNFYMNPSSISKPNGNVTGKGHYMYVWKGILERTSLINYSQITFKNSTQGNNEGYYSIKSLNDQKNKWSNYHKTYFSTLFSRLSQELELKMKGLKDEENELKKAKGDEDIITQLYYSFKNINDKWLTGASQKIRNYPYNKNRSKLIDSFVFVDRGMNPIGDTILNAEILIDMLDDPNLSLFSVLSQLLSLNGFEFFPLQNFMSFKNQTSWNNSFKIHTGGLNDNSPFFVCMYIGGAASYPSISGNGFENDGIIDISEPGVPDFNTSEPKNQDTVNDKQNKDFPWREVRAFRVRFGEQNQSMFTDIKIDSKEYPETNESIQILSRLAGDNNPDAAVPKGQNLYNLYENRSYKATVTGFGNAMIQPTQYFQLENIPMFNGAYIILSVEHNITANKMTTSFAGTKLLKYPIPRVLNPIAFTNYDGVSAGDIVKDAINYTAIIEANDKAKFTSMYNNNNNTLKIR